MRVRLWCSNGMCGGGDRENIIEVNEDEVEVEGMSENDREDYFTECASDWVNNIIDYGFEVLDD